MSVPKRLTRSKPEDHELVFESPEATRGFQREDKKKGVLDVCVGQRPSCHLFPDSDNYGARIRHILCTIYEVNE